MKCELIPVHSAVFGAANIAGSKYVANRAVMLAGLSEGDNLLYGVPSNDDIKTSLQVWGQLGASISHKEGLLTLKGTGGCLRSLETTLFTSASGTFSRFIVPTLSLMRTPYLVSGDTKMNTRPMGDIFDALRLLGAKVDSKNDRLPAEICGPITAKDVAISGKVSSQYISGLLIAAPLMPQGLRLLVEGELVSSKYVDMTIDLMKHWGVNVDKIEGGYHVRPKQIYQGCKLDIEADPVSSSYAMAIAAITGGEISIPRFNVNSLQGEAQFPRILEMMGCSVKSTRNEIVIKGPAELKPVEVNLSDMPDITQTLAVLASFAKGTTRMTGIGHLRYKESDRIADTATELRKAGIEVSFTDNSMQITGGQAHACDIQTHDDHRMAMSMALLGLKIPGVKIHEAEVVSKSFPLYWDMLRKLGIRVDES